MQASPYTSARRSGSTAFARIKLHNVKSNLDDGRFCGCCRWEDSSVGKVVWYKGEGNRGGEDCCQEGQEDWVRT